MTNTAKNTIFNITLEDLYQWLLTKSDDTRFLIDSCEYCLVAQYLLEQGFTGIQVHSNFWLDYNQSLKDKGFSFNQDPIQAQLIVDFIDAFDNASEDFTITKSKAIEILQEVIDNHD